MALLKEDGDKFIKEDGEAILRDAQLVEYKFVYWQVDTDTTTQIRYYVVDAPSS